MKKKYVWKELSDDGLLKEPKEMGPYYDSACINGLYCDGFDSEEEAIKRLKELKEKYEYSMLYEYVLITFYDLRSDN